MTSYKKSFELLLFNLVYFYYEIRILNFIGIKYEIIQLYYLFDLI